MTGKKNILVIIGSASENSANEKLVDNLATLTKGIFKLIIIKDLKILSHFDPELSISNPPKEILDFRNKIENADGIVISTPEYIFSIPAGLKNAIEWCVSTTVFTDKPVGLITASANGIKRTRRTSINYENRYGKIYRRNDIADTGNKRKNRFAGRNYRL